LRRELLTDRMPTEQTVFCGYIDDAAQPFARRAGRSFGRLLGLLTLSSIVLLAADAGQELRAETLKAKIVGLGAATCHQFNDDIKSNALIRRDYLAWAQGFMSGILSSRPPGIDEGLDLNPATFGLVNQLQFLEDHCAKNTSLDFSDAVEALYKRLRQEGKT
jgi:hypothetical protein